MNIILFDCRFKHFAWISFYYILFLQVTIFHKSIVVQHSVFLYSWWWYVIQQHTHRMRCCLSSSTVVARTCHSVTCTLHFLLCSGLNLTPLYKVRFSPLWPFVISWMCWILSTNENTSSRWRNLLGWQHDCNSDLVNMLETFLFHSMVLFLDNTWRVL
jgi:hypothetical protein